MLRRRFIQTGYGLAAEWTAANPVLHKGEFGSETDTGGVKVGNGSDAWTALAYITGGGGGGGAINFVDLDDVPPSYSGQAGQLVAVKGAEDGLEFITPPSGSSGALEYLGSVALTGSSVELLTIGDSSHAKILLVFTDVKFSNDLVNLYCKVKTAGGVQSSNYKWGGWRWLDSTASGSVAGSGDTKIILADQMGNATDESLAGEVSWFNPHGSTWKRFTSQFQYTSATPNEFGFAGQGAWLTTTDLTGFEFSISAGTFAGGTVRAYGLKAS